MPTQTVHPTKPVVKLSEPALVAGIGRGERLYVQYQATLQTSLDLDDAIRMAQMVLSYAARNGIAIPEASADRDLMGQQWDEDEEGYSLRF
jgi:hypothetical protein